MFLANRFRLVWMLPISARRVALILTMLPLTVGLAAWLVTSGFLLMRAGTQAALDFTSLFLPLVGLLGLAIAFFPMGGDIPALAALLGFVPVALGALCAGVAMSMGKPWLSPSASVLVWMVLGGLSFSLNYYSVRRGIHT
jgi:hypothetical protein